MHVLDALLESGEAVPPAALIDPADRSWMRQLRDALPPLPVGEPEGDTPAPLLPAAWCGERKNHENCELYAVFPYPLGALGGPFHEAADAAWPNRHVRTVGGWMQDAVHAAMLGRADEAADAAWPNRHVRTVGGWMQDAVHAAMLGRADEAADMLTAVFATEYASEAQRKHLLRESDPAIRFPGFFGPNFDWVPDQDHTGVNMLALQKMLLQTQHGQLRLLPAWPSRWNVHFRLHAPHGTTVEARLENGVIEDLHVQPQDRAVQVVTEFPRADQTPAAADPSAR